MRILVTGLEGFTGHYVKCELESHGYEVVGLKANLTDLAELRREVQSVRPQAVIHLAAISFVGHGDPNAFYQVNLIGTRNLLEALVDQAEGLQCVLLASSANVYGNAAEGMLTETTVPHPSNDYAVSKLAMEYMARLWFDRLPIVIVRPFNYTGIGQSSTFLLPKIVDHFRRKAPIIELGNLDVSRDFSDVRRVAAIYCKLLETKPRGEVFNICSGHATSLSEVLALMSEISGHQIEVQINPAFVRANEVKLLLGNSEKLEHAIGSQVQVPLRETLEWMYRAQLYAAPPINNLF